MTKFITLKTGERALVDDQDYERLAPYSWRLKKKTGKRVYVVRTSRGGGVSREYYMHREIMDAPARVPVDHRDGNTLNNIRGNLRFCTTRQNNCNRPGKAGSFSSYKGVGWHQQLGRWQVQIQLNGQGKYLGVFADEREAAEAYNKAAKDMFGEFAWLNDLSPQQEVEVES